MPDLPVRSRLHRQRLSFHAEERRRKCARGASGSHEKLPGVFEQVHLHPSLESEVISMES